MEGGERNGKGGERGRKHKGKGELARKARGAQKAKSAEVLREMGWGWGAAGIQGVPSPCTRSSRAPPFSPCLEIFLKPLYVSLCLPTAVGQSSAVLCIYLLNIT